MLGSSSTAFGATLPAPRETAMKPRTSSFILDRWNVFLTYSHPWLPPMVTGGIPNAAVFFIIPLWPEYIIALHLCVPQTPSCMGSAEPGGGMPRAEGVLGVGRAERSQGDSSSWVT